MHLGANMGGDQADDAFGFGGVNTLAGIAASLTELVDPEPRASLIAGPMAVFSMARRRSSAVVLMG